MKLDFLANCRVVFTKEICNSLLGTAIFDAFLNVDSLITGQCLIKITAHSYLLSLLNRN